MSNTTLTDPAPEWLNKGDQAWQLTAGTLVALQSIPGLAMLYAGFVKKKWAINSAFMVFYAFAATLICWVIWAYKMAFGEQWGKFPLVVSGLGVFLTKLGVLDYSGGYVIHLSSGTAGFTAAFWVGPRLQRDKDSFYPNNVLLMLVGAGILWVCWNGFNGGDPYSASPDAGVAVLNTNICTAMSLLVWTILDWIFFKKPSVIGAVQGEITGLVAITPAAGFVTGWGAIVIGACSGLIPWISMNSFGRMKWMKKVDDVMGVFHTHLVAGFLGGFLTGIFATIDGCAAFGVTNLGGAIEGNGKQVWVQIVGALFIIGLNLFMTTVICLFIQYVLRIPLRLNERQLLVGDDAVHGEEAYALFFEGERSHISLQTTTFGSDHVIEGQGEGSSPGNESAGAAKERAPA
ncbi:ammonium transporter [Penicillium sp. IBT 18751x]|nr:ammonium transporter [Penicillium sp. IBT 18751x]